MGRIRLRVPALWDPPIKTYRPFSHFFSEWRNTIASLLLSVPLPFKSSSSWLTIPLQYLGRRPPEPKLVQHRILPVRFQSLLSMNPFRNPSLLLALAGLSGAAAFAPSPTSRASTRLWSENGRIEQIEFKIYPDGRVEETVRGVKGENCHKVTEKINEKLGKVIQSAPTEEMYEQEVVIDQTLTESISDSGSSWEGQSSSW